MEITYLLFIDFQKLVSSYYSVNRSWMSKRLYDYNIEELVNQGYVVFTIEHIYDSMLTVLPNGEILEPPKKEITQEVKENLIDIRKNDILFVLNQLEKLNNEDDIIKNKLDLQRIGIVGHSLGGAAVFKASKCDSRIKAAVLFDASLQ